MYITKSYLIILMMTFNFLNAQSGSSKSNIFIEEKEAFLQKKDSFTALGDSIKNNAAHTYFERAKNYFFDKSRSDLQKGLEYIREAVELEPRNIEYLLLLAKIREELFHTHKLYFEERQAAFDEYKKVLDIDSNNVEALYSLGRLKTEDFLKIKNAEAKGGSLNEALSPLEKSLKYGGRSTLAYDKKNEFNNTRGNFPTISLQEYAWEDYREAEKYLLHAIKYDSIFEKSYIEISKLNIYNNTPHRAIPLWNNLGDDVTLSKDAHIFLGVLFYLTKELAKSAKEFKTAIFQMSPDEQKDFTVNSVNLLLKPKYEKEINSMGVNEKAAYIKHFWEISDPLLLSAENERLIEHYYRVAYANIFFGNSYMKIEGWKTDRGEILIRYGQPLKKIRYMQEIDDFSTTPKPRTEVWDYGDKSFAFIDPTRTNKFIFAQSWTAMVPMNTYDEVINLRKTKPEEYIPIFEGPIFDLSYQTYQFASKNRAQTDIFLSYEINFSDTSTAKEKFADGYEVGLFMFDKNFNKQSENRKTYTNINSSSDYAVNSLEMTLPQQSGNLAFEMMRKKDKGVTSYHGKFNVRGFSNSDLGISDVVLATDVEIDKEINGGIKRNGISLLPNPTKAFSPGKPLFFYYEVYNLQLNANKLTDFEQKITIQKKEQGGVVNSLLSVVGLDKEGKKVALTSKYQTQEKDPQMYIQLDMNKYEAGEYIITVSIKDIITGKEVSSQTEINWQ